MFCAVFCVLSVYLCLVFFHCFVSVLSYFVFIHFDLFSVFSLTVPSLLSLSAPLSAFLFLYLLFNSFSFLHSFLSFVRSPFHKFSLLFLPLLSIPVFSFPPLLPTFLSSSLLLFFFCSPLLSSVLHSPFPLPSSPVLSRGT